MWVPYSPGSRVYFLAKGPHWTFLWWCLDADRVAGARTQLAVGAGEPCFTLRIHDVTGVIFDGENSLDFFDVDATVAKDHWYLYVPGAGRSYCAEVGLKAPDGRFISLARSATLRLPRGGPAPAEIWSTISL